jgi:uncharacterized protein with GYD domain
MSTFLMFTRLAPGTEVAPGARADLDRIVIDRIRTECPAISWRANLTVHGPWDYVDIFDAPDLQSAFTMSSIVREYGHAHTEVWPAEEWDQLRDLVRHISVEC